MITAILHSLIGFYLQLVPCAFFASIPFVIPSATPKDESSHWSLPL